MSHLKLKSTAHRFIHLLRRAFRHRHLRVQISISHNHLSFKHKYRHRVRQIQRRIYHQYLTQSQSLSVQTLTLTRVHDNIVSSTGLVTNPNNITVVDIGFLYSIDDPLMLTPTQISVTPITNTFAKEFNTEVDNGIVYLKAYATTASQTFYGQILSVAVSLCLKAGTLITMADRSSKKIEDITYNDLLLVWDFDLGQFSTAYPLWIKKSETTSAYNQLIFSDGRILETIDQHRIYNADSGRFTYPMTYETPLYTTTFTENQTYTHLIQKTVIYEQVEYYNIITNYHMNLFANGILTSCRYNNLYPIENMKFMTPITKLNPNLNDSDHGIDLLYYHGLRLSEQNIPIENSIEYIERLKSKRLE